MDLGAGAKKQEGRVTSVRANKSTDLQPIRFGTHARCLAKSFRENGGKPIFKKKPENLEELSVQAGVMAAGQPHKEFQSRNK